MFHTATCPPTWRLLHAAPHPQLDSWTTTIHDDVDVTAGHVDGPQPADSSAAAASRGLEHVDENLDDQEAAVESVGRPRGFSGPNGVYIAESPSREQLLAT